MGLFKVKELIVYTEKKLFRFKSLHGVVWGRVLVTLLYEAKDGLYRVLLLYLLRTVSLLSCLFSPALKKVAVTSGGPF